MNPVHLAFVAMIALIFLGPKKLPELARSIGSGMREFRESMSLDNDHEDTAGHLPVATAAATPAEPSVTLEHPTAAEPPPASPAPAAGEASTAPAPPPAAPPAA